MEMEHNKKVFYTEAAYAAGIIILAFGTAIMATADFGVSVVVAPAYLLHLKLSQFFPFFSFGMAEYVLQAMLLMLMILVLRRFRGYYLFSFVTAVFYGLVLDATMKLMVRFVLEDMLTRIIFYLIGILCCSGGVALLFHTYIALEVYELLIKEVAEKYHFNINHVKTVYDCTSCVIAIAMSFLFFGMFHFEGIKAGTILCAPINGWLIGKWSGLYERRWTFQDRFSVRKYFA